MILPLGKTRSRLAFDVPNARAKGRGRTKLGETGQSVTPRPLERRVGRQTRKEWLLLFAFRSWLLNIRRNTRQAAIAPLALRLRLTALHCRISAPYRFELSRQICKFNYSQIRIQY